MDRSEGTTGVVVDVVRRREDLPALREAWNRLAAADPRDGMFRAYAWNCVWLRHIAPHAVPHIVTVSRDGELVGLASLCETTYTDRIYRVAALASTGREAVSGDFLDLVAAPGAEGVVREAVFGHIGGDLRRRPLAVLGECLQGSDTAAHAERWARAAGRDARWQEERTCPYIELPPTVDRYMATLSRSLRGNLRRGTRQLLDESGCEILRLRGASEVAPHLDTFYRLHAARWQEEGQAGNFVRPGFQAFLRDFIVESAPEVTTELYLLRDPQGPFAALLLFRWGRAVLYYQGGWDPATPHARRSPGLVLVSRSIADAIEDGYAYYEFLQGDESYKRRFTERERRTATLLVAGRGLSPRAYLAAMRLKDRAKALLRRRRGSAAC